MRVTVIRARINKCPHADTQSYVCARKQKEVNVQKRKTNVNENRKYSDTIYIHMRIFMETNKKVSSQIGIINTRHLPSILCNNDDNAMFANAFDKLCMIALPLCHSSLELPECFSFVLCLSHVNSSSKTNSHSTHQRIPSSSSVFLLTCHLCLFLM